MSHKIHLSIPVLFQWANFSRLNKSFIVSVNGNREMKSCVVSLSIKVAVITVSSVLRLIFIVFARAGLLQKVNGICRSVSNVPTQPTSVRLAETI